MEQPDPPAKVASNDLLGGWRAYEAAAKALRRDGMVVAWIEQYQRERRAPPHEDCRDCSYPHDPHMMCNTAHFGQFKLGGHSYYVSFSDVVARVDFMRRYAPAGAHHWRGGRFFRRTDAGVEVHFYEPYNNWPQLRTWLIPTDEWATIVEQMKTPNGPVNPDRAPARVGG